MSERNTDERDLLTASGKELREVFHLTPGSVADVLFIMRDAIVRQCEAKFARSVERAVRERERAALGRLAEVARRKEFRESEVCENDHRDLADASDILAFRDREYPALPLPIPPCPLSGGREVRWEGGENFRIGFPGGQSESISLHRLIREAIDPRTDLRTLADWLDSLPENNA